MPSLSNTSVLVLTVVLCLAGVAAGAGTMRAAGPAVPPATMPVPADYRTWVFLASGLDMTYAKPGGAPAASGHASVFDNVFVDPTSYRVFVRTGIWPDNTVLVLENRVGEHSVSINKAGLTQGRDVTGLELHAKIGDSWAFYQRGKNGSEHLIPRPADCYTCHEQHAAVDTTFVQFYPTLLPIAKARARLSPTYLAETPLAR